MIKCKVYNQTQMFLFTYSNFCAVSRRPTTLNERFVLGWLGSIKSTFNPLTYNDNAFKFLLSISILRSHFRSTEIYVVNGWNLGNPLCATKKKINYNN